jgi:hypothetical protein
MQRYIGAGPNDWRFLASPVSGATINDWQDNFITSGFPGASYPSYPFVSVYTYDETAPGNSINGYNAPASANDPLTPGKGFWCYMGPFPITVDVTGPPVKFNQTFSVSYTPSGGVTEDGYVMLGNPYPCPINWNSTGWTKNNINDAIYIWNPALQQYASWVSGVGTNGGSAYIASSQAFWVQTNATNPTLSCTENVKVSNNAPFIGREAATSFDALKLIVSGNGYSDEAILRFGNGASKAFDASLDARKIYSSGAGVPGIASLDSTGAEMSVSSFPVINGGVNIPVKTIVSQSGAYSISIDNAMKMPEGYCIILEDLATNTKMSMNAPLTYSFMIADTTVAPRFLIHISSPATVRSAGASCYHYSDGKAIARVSGQGPWNYSWYNQNNVLIRQVQSLSSSDTLKNLAAGNYSLHLNDAGGMCTSFTAQVNIFEPPLVHTEFYCANRINAGKGDSLVVQNECSGALQFIWNFGDGTPTYSQVTAPPHHFSKPGQYEVSLIAWHNSCFSTFSRKVQVASPDYLLEGKSEFNTISVFPNPASGILYLDNKSTADGIIRIYTASGEEVLSGSVTLGSNKISIERFDAGAYLYSVELSDGSSYKGKLIKK